MASTDELESMLVFFIQEVRDQEYDGPVTEEATEVAQSRIEIGAPAGSFEREKVANQAKGVPTAFLGWAYRRMGCARRWTPFSESPAARSIPRMLDPPHYNHLLRSSCGYERTSAGQP